MCARSSSGCPSSLSVARQLRRSSTRGRAATAGTAFPIFNITVTLLGTTGTQLKISATNNAVGQQVEGLFECDYVVIGKPGPSEAAPRTAKVVVKVPIRCSLRFWPGCRRDLRS